MTQRVTISLPDAQAAAVDAVCDEYSLARSRVIRDVLAKQMGDGGDLEEAVLEAIPEATLTLAKREQQEEAMKERQKLREKAASYNDRVLGYFRKRLEGDAAYSYDDMKGLAEGYKDDAHIWHDSEQEAAEKAAQVDVWLAWYRAGLYAREHAESVETEVNSDDVSGWFEVGHDLHRLREHRDAVEQHLVQLGDGAAMNDSDVIRSVASAWSVCEGAVHLLLESMTPEGTTIAHALQSGSSGFETRSEKDARALEAARNADGAELRTGGETDADGEPQQVAKPDSFGGTVDADALETDGGER